MKRIAAVAVCLYLLPACAKGPVIVKPPPVEPPKPIKCVDGNPLCGREGTISTRLAEACPDNRWVGRLLAKTPPAKCPEPGAAGRGRWTSRKLVDDREQPPAELRRYCVYEWEGGQGGRPQASSLPNRADMRLERDCQVVAPQTAPSAGARALYHRAFAKQVNLPDYPPLEVKTRRERNVDIYVLDTSDDELTTNLPSGGQPHGLAVGALARYMSCYFSKGEAPYCAANIRSLAALSLGRKSFGYISDVTDAIHRAMKLRRTSSRKAIFNLSLGFDASYTEQTKRGERVAEQALLRAIQWATCSGVLVIASSGNRYSEKFSPGPTFPGGWESVDRAAAPVHPIARPCTPSAAWRAKTSI